VQEEASAEESDVHRQLNKTAAQNLQDGIVEGNYCHFHGASLHEFTPADPRRSWKREYLRRSVRGRRRALEIGFNAGHSAAIMLSAQPNLNIHSIDIATHPYTRPCADYLQSKFGDRFNFTVGDSKSLITSLDLASYDFIHIDGGHDFESAKSDFVAVCDQALPGTLIMVDDAYVPHIAILLTEAVHKGIIEAAAPVFPCSGENRLFCKRKPDAGTGEISREDSLAAELRICRVDAASSRATVDAMYASTSWRATAPLRALGRMVRRRFPGL